MIGRGTGGEDTLERIRKIRAEHRRENNSKTKSPKLQNPSRSEGEIDFQIPEEITFQHSGETEQEEEITRFLTDPEKIKELGVEYELLFGEGGYEILRDKEEGETKFNPGEIGALGYTNTLQLMETLGLLSTEGQERPSEKGKQRYSMWNSFESYLGSAERLKDLEQNLRDTEIPEFYSSWNIELDLNEYFTQINNGETTNFRTRWVQEHDNNAEFYDIASVLYDSQSVQSGEMLLMLEEIKNEEADPVSLHKDVGINGTVEQDDRLNDIGERVYRSVRTDYMSL